ncbi:MAG: hypothetical protein LLP51_06150 [Halorhodospira halophila]|nr:MULTISPECIES: hypothetical protein [Halorhodospira]MCC3750959.1 hypothetical protein [Halorhodospira halophila]MCG5527956.1 hypothetical protein [Halorhodospira halophila]MCG5533284.1 hypothetical protein [Halorhodospira sp. 9621]MCG5536876.1 hypothetical protein [Halorhodospira sp. 9622]MCG5542174.1 hypothetical protein [Halorhodospira sp. 9628]
MDLPGFIIFKLALVALAMAYAVREIVIMRRDLRQIREERERDRDGAGR